MNLWDKLKSAYYNHKYLNDFINEYETDALKHIWGITSYDNLSGYNSNLMTMNDIELLYWKEDNKYSVSIEAIYSFEDWDKGTKDYLNSLLDAFTEWMKNNGYDTEISPFFYAVFTGNNINTKFDTIEEAYANFKMLVNGFCSIPYKQKENNNESD